MFISVYQAVVRLYLLASGSFDSSVHISEEASNAATAVPWAIVNAVGIAGILGWGQCTLINKSISPLLIFSL